MKKLLLKLNTMKNILLFALTCFTFSSCSNMKSDAEKVCDFKTQETEMVNQLVNKLSKSNLELAEINEVKASLKKMNEEIEIIMAKYDKEEFQAYLQENCGNISEISSRPEVKVKIEGTFSGSDNLGMQSTITLYAGGTMTILNSIGSGAPSYGRWSGTASNISLYTSNDYGQESFLADAKVTSEGLRINGGKFYSRK
ncbi:hypothetical protein N8376_00090 [Flavobacteriaceae bacterium]|nr:hypothetical protein [Flavobacteriaceae bacterium]MDC1491744.1 hypothetical protein [Flavobacteriaceae bacterium]